MPVTIVGYYHWRLTPLQLSRLHREPHWRHVATTINTPIHSTIKPWLLDSCSLTQKLVKKSKGNFCVHILNQKIQRAQFSENEALHIGNRRWVLIREVALKGNGMPWVYARTAIPLTTLKGSLRRLRYLGTRPLGGQLFTNPNMRRGAISIAAIAASHIHPSLQAQKIRPLWGRRSIFKLHNKPLLVCEIFLETLINMPNQ